MELLRQYGIGDVIKFPLITFGATDYNDTPATFAPGDVKISKNGGAFANTTNLPVHLGLGWYTIILTDTEMEAYDIVISIIDQTATKLWEDQGILINTKHYVDAFLDEVIDGGSHNVNKSLAKRIRNLQENLLYEGGFIYINTVSGTAGAENYVNGTLDNPVDNMVDANTLASSLGISSFKITAGSTITLTASQENQEFIGEAWALELEGQSISGSAIHGAELSGTAIGANVFHLTHCEINGVTLPPCTAFACAFTGDLTVGSAGSFFFHNCYSGVAGVSLPSIDVGELLGDVNINLRQYSGGMEFKNLGQVGTDNVSMEGNGQVVTNANCVGGIIAIRGAFTKADNSGGAVTFSEDARLETAFISLSTTPIPELTDVPLSNADAITALKFVQMYFQNKKIMTATLEQLMQADSATPFMEAEMSSTAVSRTKGKGNDPA